eukprot:TRINITY_DN13159_c0_g1_i1.p1 TRINITY_DN13159_c0_g1~~TRINITY_DN13159_c0_g1_i1.p1  ORF type:complete len:345 (+),score=68.87 TRINITY_DN13159_c0_g1_i1:276-1310(+)
MQHTEEEEETLRVWWIKHKNTIVNILWFLALIGVMIVVGVTVLYFFKDDIIAALKWIDRQGFWGNIILCILLAISGIPPMPFYGILLLSCAFLYRWWGLLTMMVGANIGAWLGFAVLRSGDCVYIEHRIKRSPLMGKIVKAIEHNPWKLVLLTRLSPLPYSLLNGLFGFAKDVRFSVYATASFVGMWLEHISAVIYGVTLREFADVIDSDRPPSPGRIAIYVFQAIVITVIVIIVTYYVKKSLHIENDEDLEASVPSTPNLLQTPSHSLATTTSSSIPTLEKIPSNESVIQEEEEELPEVRTAVPQPSEEPVVTTALISKPSSESASSLPLTITQSTGDYEEIR